MGLVLITPPITAPVTLDEVKRQVRVHPSDTTYDVELQAYLDAAISFLDGKDGILQIALEPQTYRYTLDAFGGAVNPLALPIGPVISVGSVKYYTGGALTTVDAEAYGVRAMADHRSDVMPVGQWPTADTGINKVEVEFTAGFEGEMDSATYISAVPKSIRQAILLLVGHWWRNRSAVEIVSSGDLVDVPLAFEALVQPFKRIILA